MFRLHFIRMTADTSQMFQGISLHLGDRDLHPILSRDESKQLLDFRMTRLTFGATSSPFLATKVLRQVATVIMDNIYLDDSLSGANRVEMSLLSGNLSMKC